MIITYLIFSIVSVILIFLVIGFIFAHRWFQKKLEQIKNDEIKRLTALSKEIEERHYQITRRLERIDYFTDRYVQQSEKSHQIFSYLQITNKELIELQNQLRKTITESFRIASEFRIPEINLIDEVQLNIWNYISRSIVNYDRLMPNNLPPVSEDIRITLFEQNGIKQLISAETGETGYRAYYWARRLMDEVDRYEFKKVVPGFKYLSFGFFNSTRQYQHPNVNEMLFGVIVHVDKLIPLFNSESILTNIQIDGYNFPIAIRTLTETLHCNHPNPETGTMSCIAYSRVGSEMIGPGILTAKHVTDSIIGKSVQLGCGGHGRVADIAPEGIDAALVICKSCHLAEGLRITPMELVAPYMDVQFQGRSSGLIKTKVTSITDTRGILDHHQLPVRIFLGSKGTYGDSGALVTDLSGRYAVGIYIGGYTDSVGVSGGIAQHAYQAAVIMDLQLYDITN